MKVLLKFGELDLPNEIISSEYLKKNGSKFRNSAWKSWNHYGPWRIWMKEIRKLKLNRGRRRKRRKRIIS